MSKKKRFAAQRPETTSGKPATDPKSVDVDAAIARFRAALNGPLFRFTPDELRQIFEEGRSAGVDEFGDLPQDKRSGE